MFGGERDGWLRRERAGWRTDRIIDGLKDEKSYGRERDGRRDVEIDR